MTHLRQRMQEDHRLRNFCGRTIRRHTHIRRCDRATVGYQDNFWPSLRSVPRTDQIGQDLT
jgi:hypothetical protein